jgi:hypothetical protein
MWPYVLKKKSSTQFKKRKRERESLGEMEWRGVERNAIARRKLIRLLLRNEDKEKSPPPSHFYSFCICCAVVFNCLAP